MMGYVVMTKKRLVQNFDFTEGSGSRQASGQVFSGVRQRCQSQEVSMRSPT